MLIVAFCSRATATPIDGNGARRGDILNQFLIEAVGLNKIQGKPFLVSEIEAKIEEMLR